MYPDYMLSSIGNVERTRPKRLELVKARGKNVFPAMSEQERKIVLERFHPDYKSDARKPIRIGPNKGDRIMKLLKNIGLGLLIAIILFFGLKGCIGTTIGFGNHKVYEKSPEERQRHAITNANVTKKSHNPILALAFIRPLLWR